MLKKFVLTAIVIILSGCATSYQPSGVTGGFSEMQLNDDIYRVSFRGNAYTAHENVQNYLLRRCAELTKAKGYNYFVILESNVDKKDSQYTTPTTVSTYSKSNISITPGQTYKYSRYQDSVVIRMLHNCDKEPNAYKADTVLGNFYAPIR